MAGRHGSAGKTADGSEEKKQYINRGSVFYSRKWLGNNLARHPAAFTIYFHLLGWANHVNGRWRIGQVPIGERDLGERLGMSVTTIRKWLRWLRDKGWIILEPTVWGKERGTIVTVLRYAQSQSFSVYKMQSEDQKMILTPESEDQTLILNPESEDQTLILNPESEDQKMILNPPESGSENDPSYTHNSLRVSGDSFDALSQRSPTDRSDEKGEENGVSYGDDIENTPKGAARIDAEIALRKKEQGTERLVKGAGAIFAPRVD